MSNRRCAAKACFNTQGCRPNLKFFNFPKEVEICHQWAINCDREDLLDRPIEQLTKFMLCADHFESHWFLNPKFKTKFIRTGNPIPTIFYNNLADFVPKSLQKSFAARNKYRYLNADVRNEYYRNTNNEKSISQTTADLFDMIRDGETSDSSQFPLTDTDDYTVEINIDLDPGTENSSAMGSCYKMCRLCARLVYEHKLTSIFTSDSPANLASKINRLIPDKVLEGDGLPEHVCMSCIAVVNECDSAVQSFIAADRKLRNLFRFQNVVSNQGSEESEKSDSENPQSVVHDAGNSGLTPALAEFLAVRDEGSSSSSNYVPLRETVNQKCSEVYIIKQLYHPTQNEFSKSIDRQDSAYEEQAQCEDSNGIKLEMVENACNVSNPANAMLTSDHELPLDIKIEDSWTINTEENRVHNSLKDSKVYQCQKCETVFNERNKLLIHEITEHIFKEKNETKIPVLQKKYRREKVTCRKCGQVFSGKKPLRRHVLDKHIPIENICEYCGVHYQKKSQLEVHRRLHTDEKPFTCETCNTSFHFKKELQRHKRSSHSMIKSLTCSVCNKTCPNRNAVWRHEKIHTDERNVLCYLCGKVLSNPQSMRVHMRTHSNDRPCSCPTCGKSFKDNTSVSKHMLMHSASKDFTCEICGRAFYSKALVKQHKLSHSGVKPHKCDICGAAYNRLGNLNQHKKKHSANPHPVASLSHECVVCGKRMHSELTLKYHLAKHTGEKKPFDCEVCGKRFVAVDPYRVHMRIHTGERPYQCTTCGKTFRSSFTLKQHAALHRDECPYACPFCERKFKRLQSLIVHKRTHTGEKPHRCPLCGRGFAQKGDMVKHTKTHGRDRPATANKIKEEGVVMEIEHITELALSDSEITSEFLIDMPIVEVETEIQSEIHPEISTDISSGIA